MIIQCLIERDGDTTVTRGGVNYVFRQNKQGHAICEVQNDDHAKLFLRMGPKIYRPYGAQAEVHAKRLKMVARPEPVEEFEEDGEVFEESVGIVEGRDGEGGPVALTPAEPELFPELESAEEAMGAEGPDDLVLSQAARMIEQGAKKPEVAKRLQEQFGLSQAEAQQVLSEVTKK
jgi:hypothetical protein